MLQKEVLKNYMETKNYDILQLLVLSILESSFKKFYKHYHFDYIFEHKKLENNETAISDIFNINFYHTFLC